MYIKEINLKNFRNYEKQRIILDKGINVFYGDNAQGKTNIIESIFLCAIGKSYRTNKEKELIKFNENLSEVKVNFQKRDREGNINIIISNKKDIFINGIKQNKLSNLLGKINIVTFSPEDIEIIKEGPQRRRKFLDMMIGSLKPKYIQLLNEYNFCLNQRNEYLKIQKRNNDFLDVLDDQLSEISYKIFVYRNEYIKKIENMLQDKHNLITKSGKTVEKVSIKYISNGKSKKEFYDVLQKERINDIKRGYTTSGIHRDDFVIYINNKIVYDYGSQGQQRTIVLTLKLCELEIVTDEIEEDPIFLLDDFMSELDEKRRNCILENLNNNQVIITCTNNIILNKNIKSFYIENGNIIENNIGGENG